MTRFKQQIAKLEMIPSDGGCFELTVDGKLLYSKLSTGEFPDEASLESELAARAP